MRDVEKTSMEHETNLRRIRRRRRGMSRNAALVILFAAGTIATLSMTVLFNIKTIQVAGESANYTAEQIVEAIGVKAGDNLVRLNVEEAEQRGVANLIYVERLDIKRDFTASTLEVMVTPCVEAYNVKYENGTLIVSQNGRILQDAMDPNPDLISVYGYQPVEAPVPGDQIHSENEKYDRILQDFMTLIREGDLEYPIISIDMTNMYNIKVNFDDRIEFAMGNGSDIEYKIAFAQDVISRQSPDKEGYMTMIGDNQCNFRDKANYEATQKRREEQIAKNEETTEPTEETTGASGE
ncbi:MAG: FtsQ-type POTRA domain-containing protein [Oscillospiraceae bacterium]|nr:FtsQ-type POTRA domain-containing protein [Oscillospiraceae bacterium]MBQ7013311.1 FtsQ-type POTRA domain-containing protein [Oscillospiraceae bacterium]